MQFPYRKVLVLGCGGAGKSTLASDMGRRFSLPVIHLDRIWWRSGWVNCSEEEFDALLSCELAKPAWVMDGNYLRTLAVRLQAADAAVLYDLPVEVCLQSVYARAKRYAGRSRPDMPEGCIEQVDGEFEAWIRSFRKETLPQVRRLLGESGKPYFVFSSRAAAARWLEGYENR